MDEDQEEGREERVTNIRHTPATPKKLREAAADAELRGDWLEAALLVSASDVILQLQAQNQAYRHALSSGVSINLVSKRRWFNIRQD